MSYVSLSGFNSSYLHVFYEGLTHRLARRYLFNSLFGVGDPRVHVEFFPGLVIRISYIELFI